MKLKKEKENRIIQDIFDNHLFVQNGPFKGLKYIEQASGSALLPKVLGSYEEPIQEWIEKVITKKNYDQILDIGCAEGYYACGFAMKLPETTVIAYDIDEEARTNTSELASLNSLNNIVIKSVCTHTELDENINKNTLIFCDIEGYEDILLDPELASNLKYSDMIVESHDCFVPGITSKLIERFLHTHKINIVVDYPFRLGTYSTPNYCSVEQMREVTDERRPKAMKFIYLESICEKN